MDGQPTRTIRAFETRDLEAAEALLASSIGTSAANFHWEAPAPGGLAEEWRALDAEHVWLSLELGGRWAGFASSRPYKTREAYKWTAELGIYLEPWARGAGHGRPLYGALCDALREHGFRLAVANITLPGEASCGLHRALGFEPVGVLPEVGWKLGRWWDVGIWQLQLQRPRARS
jgi:phosphinothricin acetyltransferase